MSFFGLRIHAPFVVSRYCDFDGGGMDSFLIRSEYKLQSNKVHSVSPQRPGPLGSSIFGTLRRCSSFMYHRGYTVLVAPCTVLKDGTPNVSLILLQTLILWVQSQSRQADQGAGTRSVLFCVIARGSHLQFSQGCWQGVSF